MGNGRVGTIVFTAALVADQLSKSAALAWLPSASSAPERLFAVHRNPGVAFALLRNNPGIVLSVNIATLCCFVFFFRKYTPGNATGVALLAAGMTGNLIDRLLYGAVVDWIRLVVYVNVADILLCAGALLLLADRLKRSGPE